MRARLTHPVCTWAPRSPLGISYSTLVLDICSIEGMSTVRLTKPTIAVLEVLLASTDDNPAWGLSVCNEADLGSGTVYPILDRLEDRGWVSSWVEAEPHPGRPPRRYYTLTNTGRSLATEALEARRARRQHVLRWAGGSA